MWGLSDRGHLAVVRYSDARRLEPSGEKPGKGRKVDDTGLWDMERGHARCVRLDIANPVWSESFEPGQAIGTAPAFKFIERFDANSYLLNMKAWQSFDLAAEAGVDNLTDLFTLSKNHNYMVFSIDSDVCFYPEEQDDLVAYLKASHVPHRRITVHSEKGHDSFLLEPRLFAPHLRDTLTSPWHD